MAKSWTGSCQNCHNTRRLWVNPATGMHLCAQCQASPEKIKVLFEAIKDGSLPLGKKFV